MRGAPNSTQLKQSLYMTTSNFQTVNMVSRCFVQCIYSPNTSDNTVSILLLDLPSTLLPSLPPSRPPSLPLSAPSGSVQPGADGRVFWWEGPEAKPQAQRGSHQALTQVSVAGRG